MNLPLLDAVRRNPAFLRVTGAFGFVAVVTALGLSACATNDQVLAYEETSNEDDSGTILADDGSVAQPADSGTDRGVDSSVAKCGDGTLGQGEECDDGNTTSGDGCSSLCKNEVTTPASCPGTAITLTDSGDAFVGSVTGDTSSGVASIDSAKCGGGTANDLVYTFVPTAAGRATITLQSSFDAILSARTDCAKGETEVSCMATPSGGGETSIAVSATAGQPISIVVDGADGHSGSFKLDVAIGKTVCGDGLAQLPEQCDDGNTIDGDGCSSTCQLEALGSAQGTCPGTPFFIAASTTAKTVSFAGDTSLSAKENFSSSVCSNDGGPEIVYAFTPAASGALALSLTASFELPSIMVRRECFSYATEMLCNDGADALSPLQRSFPVVADTTYYVVLDSDEVGGPFTLDVTYTPAVCGDGVKQATEACDDGNTVAGDGCSPTCAFEALPAGADACPGALITFAGPTDGTKTFHAFANTINATSDVGTTCAVAGKKDVVYRFNVPSPGYLTATVAGDFNTALSLRKACTVDTGTAIAAADVNNVACTNVDKTNIAAETLNAPIEANTDYFLVVKGGSSSSLTWLSEGSFTLDASIRPSECGNGVTDGAETCDDGNFLAGDGCDPTCHKEADATQGISCATAIPIVLDPSTTVTGGYEKSVNGGNFNVVKSNSTAAFPCGATVGADLIYAMMAPISGVAQVRIDDASYNLSIIARSACTLTSITNVVACSAKSNGKGNEAVSFKVTAGSTYYLMVDAPSLTDRGSYRMDIALQSESCGDGMVTGSEQCDDTNHVAGDGCDEHCALEPLAGIDTCPGYAVSLTGTGTAPRSKTVSLSTANLSADYASSGTSCGGNARDGVIAVTSDVAGTLDAALTAAWGATFYARSTCNDATTQLSCSATDTTKAIDTVRSLSVAVKAGVPIYFFVDGLSGATGPATLNLTVTP